MNNINELSMDVEYLSVYKVSRRDLIGGLQLNYNLF